MPELAPVRKTIFPVSFMGLSYRIGFAQMCEESAMGGVFSGLQEAAGPIGVGEAGGDGFFEAVLHEVSNREPDFVGFGCFEKQLEVFKAQRDGCAGLLGRVEHDFAVGGVEGRLEEG